MERSRFGKSKRISEMHLATVVLIPGLRSPPFPHPASNTHGDSGVTLMGGAAPRLTVTNLILSSMQKGREERAGLLGSTGFGDAGDRPWPTDLSQSKGIVRSK